jgi:hypothetical protein
MRVARVGAVPVQHRLLVQDLPLQALQGRARVDAQFLRQPLLIAAQHGQRVGLPPGPVQRQAQQLAAVLAQRVRLRERLQLGDRDLMGPHAQQRRAAPLQHRQPQLLQPGHLRHHPRGVGHFRVRLPPPQRQARLELAQCPPRIITGQRLPPRRGALVEAVHVHLHDAAVQEVAPADGAQHGRRRPRRPARFEHPPQVGHVGLQRGDGRARRVPGPQLVHDHVDGHRLARLADQQREQGSLFRRAEIHQLAGDHRLYGAQRPKLRRVRRPIPNSIPAAGYFVAIRRGRRS